MSFDYQIMSEQEALAQRFQLIKEGVYEAVVISSQDKISSTGNPIMDMTIRIYDPHGGFYDIRDFLVFTKSMMWKVIHFANSAGLLKEYENGELCSELAVNRHLQAKVVIEGGSEIPQDKLNGKPAGSKYPDKNKIVEYIKKDENQTPFDDDDLLL